MKKVLPILIALFFTVIFSNKAQVYNAGFENLNFDSSTTNWGSVYLFAVIIDSNGVSYPDSIVFDGWFNAPTTDAHSGNLAMELRNAYNYTANEGIAGRINATQDSMFTAYNPFVDVATPFQPTSLNFFYKYLPVNNDTGFARLDLYDSFGYIIGEATFLMIGTTPNYTFASVPVVYNTPGLVAYYDLNYTTAYFNPQGTFQASLGTRLLIDDVSFENPAGIEKQEVQNLFRVFPNPSQEKLYVVLNVASEFSVEVFNSAGQKVVETREESILDISGWKRGVYFIQVNSDGKSAIQKIIKD
jgi:hypothetical protein